MFFEVVLLPMYAVIAGWGGERRREAARKFVIYTLVGSVLLLLGVFTVVVAAGTGDLLALAGGLGLSQNAQYVAFALFAVAFAIKAPLWPLHTWLPDAHTEAPTVGSVILAGVLLKMGTYGLIRVGVGVAPLGAQWASPVLGILAVAAIIVGSLVCLRQVELKRLIAYSSVGHMGFVLLGIATLTVTGLQAALIGNVAHGVITGLLFFLAGAIKDRAHTPARWPTSAGCGRPRPGWRACSASRRSRRSGCPVWPVSGARRSRWSRPSSAAARCGSPWPCWPRSAGALTAAYFLRLLRRVTHGPAALELPNPRVAGIEWAAWSPLVLLALAIGLVPALILAATADPVAALTGVLR